MSEYQDHIARCNAETVGIRNRVMWPETEFPPLRFEPKVFRKFRDLGRILGLIMNELKSADVAYEDIRAFHAPSECMDLVRKGIENRVYEILKRNAVTGGELRHAVEVRTPTSAGMAAIVGEAERIWYEKSRRDHFAGVTIARIASVALFGGPEEQWSSPTAALAAILDIADNGMAYDQHVVDDDRRIAMEQRRFAADYKLH